MTGKSIIIPDSSTSSWFASAAPKPSIAHLRIEKLLISFGIFKGQCN